jgi:hypothetical protein
LGVLRGSGGFTSKSSGQDDPKTAKALQSEGCILMLIQLLIQCEISSICKHFVKLHRIRGIILHRFMCKAFARFFLEAFVDLKLCGASKIPRLLRSTQSAIVSPIMFTSRPNPAQAAYPLPCALGDGAINMVA